MQVVPAIKAKWPPFLSKNIMIQQVNARPHMSNIDPYFEAMTNANGFQIKFVQQPPNSPECNTLDLGFFVQFKAYNRGRSARLHMISY